jgi:hypothetical protein
VKDRLAHHADRDILKELNGEPRAARHDDIGHENTS